MKGIFNAKVGRNNRNFGSVIGKFCENMDAKENGKRLLDLF